MTWKHSLAIGYLLADLAIWGIVTEPLRIAQLALEWYTWPTSAHTFKTIREYRGLLAVRRVHLGL